MAVVQIDDLGTPETYIPRTLSYVDAQGVTQRVGESELATLPFPFVVLGEPGMGKTQLLAAFARASGFTVISARTLLRRPLAELQADPTAVWVIDALDELASAHADDPAQLVLQRLAALGAPPFVLSCRSADWQSALAKHDIREDYGRAPVELTIEPFTHPEARSWLATEVSKDAAGEAIDGLVDRGLEPLFGNPFTLLLIAELIKVRGEFPRTRAELFDGACDLLWIEPDRRRASRTRPGPGKARALDAAGAAFAALILTGFEAISLEAPGHELDGDLSVADIAALPEGSEIRAVLNSRLFRRPGGGDRLAPLHRTIAEYLGARWLAARLEAGHPHRILTLLTFDGGVPASLRGLHAWLAHFSPKAALEVIRTDPYGLLRYGDADRLTPEAASALLAALRRLARTNPYFRSGDWTRYAAHGLVQPAVAEEVRALILDPEIGYQLRVLLLDALKGSETTALLADDLFALAMAEGDGAVSHGERVDAAEALIALKDPKYDWPKVVEELCRRGVHDSRHLALDIMITCGLEAFPVPAIVDAALGYMGRLPGLNTNDGEVESVGPLYFLSRRLPVDLIGPVLDRFIALNPAGDPQDWNAEYALNNFIATLISRRLEGDPPDPLQLLGWLRIYADRHANHNNDEHRAIRAWIRAHDNVRRVIQIHVLFVESDLKDAWGRAWDLRDAETALIPDADDVAALLGSEHLSQLTDPAVRGAWMDMVRLAAHQEGLPEVVSAVAGAQAAGDAELETFLDQMRDPKPAPWAVEQRERVAAEALRRATDFAKHRKDFTDHIEDVRAGVLGYILSLAQAYLGHFHDMDSTAAPYERIREWLGEELLDAALIGFEAVLHRNDLPGSVQIANSYAQSRRWNFISPILVGLLERVATGRGFESVPDDVILSGRLGLEWEALGNDANGAAIREGLDRWLAARPALFETFARRLIEPQLRRPPETVHISGLHQLTRQVEVAPAVTRLAGEWLSEFPEMPAAAEIDLIDHLARFKAWDALRNAAAEREARGYRNDAHRLTWLAVAFLTDFDGARATLEETARLNPDFFWEIRRHGGISRADPDDAGGVLPRAIWFFQTFRTSFAAEPRPSGAVSGNENRWDATEYMYGMINAMAGDHSDEAVVTLAQLRDEPKDGYTDNLRMAVASQAQARREAAFTPPTLAELKAVLDNARPHTVQDLRAVVLEEIDRLQARVRGDDVNMINMFYEAGAPLTETHCRDVLAALIEGRLPFGIQRIPERLMPANKRVDLAFQLDDLQLPVEAKGQWNAALWSAAVDQLDKLYTIEWRAGGLGIYLVFWFGASVPEARRLKPPPRGEPRPTTPSELRAALEAGLPEHRRSDLTVVVFDVSR